MIIFQPFGDAHLVQGFGGKQMARHCPGLLGGPHHKACKGIHKEERLRTVLLFISMMALTLVSGLISPAMVNITMFVKELSR